MGASFWSCRVAVRIHGAHGASGPGTYLVLKKAAMATVHVSLSCCLLSLARPAGVRGKQLQPEPLFPEGRVGARDPVPKTFLGRHATAWYLPSSHKGLRRLKGHRSTCNPTMQPADLREQPACSLRPRLQHRNSGREAVCLPLRGELSRELP